MRTALYLPMRGEGEADPSRDFETDQEAWEYIFDNMCGKCQRDRARYFELHAEGIDPSDLPIDHADARAMEYPACSCEWLVVDSDKLEDCETLDDVFDAAGFKAIYKKEDS